MSGVANIKTRDEKLKELGIPEDKSIAFTDYSLDYIYDRIMTDNNKSTNGQKLLYFLNIILKEIGLDQQTYLDDIEIERALILKMDGIEFIKKYKEDIVEYGINLYEDLNYGNRKAIKNYGLSVMKGIVKYFDYQIRSRHLSNTEDKQQTRYVTYVFKKKNN